MNAVTRVLNPNAIEASYKPKQRSYRKTNLLAPDSPGAQLSGAEMSSAQTAAPKRTPTRHFPLLNSGLAFSPIVLFHMFVDRQYKEDPVYRIVIN